MVASNNPALNRSIWPLLRTSVFFLLLLFILANRYHIFETANMVVDSDQTFMWLGTKDYSEGHFYEPRFYGQDYNTFLEALIAVPFYKAGLVVYKAVPLATHILFLFPFFFTLIYLYKNGKHRQAIVGACVLLGMTTAFDIMSSLPRGFVTGLFFCSFFILSFHHPQKLSYLLLNGALLMIGYFVNPNMMIAAAPLLFYVFLHNYKRKSFWLISLIILFLYLPLYFIFDAFYVRHPEYVVYGLVHSFSSEYFFQNIQHLEQCFGHVNFFFEDHFLMLLIVFACISIATWQTEKKLFYTWILFLFVLLATFFVGKTREGTPWPYYSYSRMYICMPCVIILFTSCLPFRSSTLLGIILILTFSFEAFKLSTVRAELAYHTDHRRASGVRISPISHILDGIKVYKKYCTDNQVNHLLISTTFWLGPYLNYGAQAFDPDFPSTQETWSDRRYWIWQGKKDTVYERFMVISINYDFDKYCVNHYPFNVKRKDNFGLFLIENNTLKNADFIDILRKADQPFE